ncbi:hypothetical protein DL93DRAFT_2103209 [Clavulina sp. PMI_390]|nr:hypothetical protein DL93DRAFT_2103209 [Clavulina sp. PMI_390]
MVRKMKDDAQAAFYEAVVLWRGLPRHMLFSKPQLLKSSNPSATARFTLPTAFLQYPIQLLRMHTNAHDLAASLVGINASNLPKVMLDAANTEWWIYCAMGNASGAARQPYAGDPFTQPTYHQDAKIPWYSPTRSHTEKLTAGYSAIREAHTMWSSIVTHAPKLAKKLAACSYQVSLSLHKEQHPNCNDHYALSAIDEAVDVQLRVCKEARHLQEDLEILLKYLQRQLQLYTKSNYGLDPCTPIQNYVEHAKALFYIAPARFPILVDALWQEALFHLSHNRVLQCAKIAKTTTSIIQSCGNMRKRFHVRALCHTYMLLGICQYTLGDYDAACTSFERASSLDLSKMAQASFFAMDAFVLLCTQLHSISLRAFHNFDKADALDQEAMKLQLQKYVPGPFVFDTQISWNREHSDDAISFFNDLLGRNADGHMSTCKVVLDITELLLDLQKSFCIKGEHGHKQIYFHYLIQCGDHFTYTYLEHAKTAYSKALDVCEELCRAEPELYSTQFLCAMHYKRLTLSAGLWYDIQKQRKLEAHGLSFNPQLEFDASKELQRGECYVITRDSSLRWYRDFNESY